MGISINHILSWPLENLQEITDEISMDETMEKRHSDE